MATMTETAPPARLKARYLEEIRPELIGRFGYTSVMQAPRLEKITLNMGVGEAKQDSKALKAAVDQLATIAGQQPSVRRARKSIAAFKLREGMPVGVAVTLRGERSYEFLDRLVSIAIPRIRDFRGLSPRSRSPRPRLPSRSHRRRRSPSPSQTPLPQSRRPLRRSPGSRRARSRPRATMRRRRSPSSKPTARKRAATDGKDIASRQAGA